jgi:hypothetical protein
MFRDACDSVAAEFVARPIDFTVEYEIQARLYETLRARLAETSNLHATADASTLGETSDGYKRAYWKTVESKWQEGGGLTRVHPEVTVEQGERIDLAVLSETVDSVAWNNGSKRFQPTDLDAAFEVKFVKNKPRFPTAAAADELAELTDEELRETLDTDTNGLRADLEELARLPDGAQTFLLLFSNKNYLYAGPTTEGERNHEQAYERVGRVARDWLTRTGESTDTAILYATPRRHQWLVGSDAEA